MIDELTTMTLPQVHKARTILRKLVVRHITLHPSANGMERFLIAELAGNYAGLVRLTVGILELAAACDVPIRWSCRTGVCHSCESGLVSGAVVYGPEPFEKPAAGNVLVCCSQPIGDVVIDL
jgi:ferredoxin